MVRLLIFLGLLGLAAGGRAALAGETEDRLAEALGAQIGELVLPVRQINMGKVVQGEELLYEFPFEVRGAAVTILGLHQECGCTSLNLKPGDVLSAGQKGRIKVKADTRFFTGPFDKTVTFLTNETPSGVHMLRLRASVERVLVLEPPLVELSRVDAKARTPIKVRLRSSSKQTLHIEKVRYNEDNLKVSFYPVQNHWELSIQWKGEVPNKPWTETIEVFTDSSVRTVKIPVVGGQHTR